MISGVGCATNVKTDAEQSRIRYQLAGDYFRGHQHHKDNDGARALFGRRVAIGLSACLANECQRYREMIQ